MLYTMHSIPYTVYHIQYPTCLYRLLEPPSRRPKPRKGRATLEVGAVDFFGALQTTKIIQGSYILVLRPRISGIPETMVCKIRMFVRSFGPLSFRILGLMPLTGTEACAGHTTRQHAPYSCGHDHVDLFRLFFGFPLSVGMSMLELRIRALEREESFLLTKKMPVTGV